MYGSFTVDFHLKKRNTVNAVLSQGLLHIEMMKEMIEMMKCNFTQCYSSSKDVIICDHYDGNVNYSHCSFCWECFNTRYKLYSAKTIKVFFITDRGTSELHHLKLILDRSIITFRSCRILLLSYGNTTLQMLQVKIIIPEIIEYLYLIHVS